MQMGATATVRKSKEVPVRPAVVPDYGRELQDILSAMGVPLIDSQARVALQRVLRRADWLHRFAPQAKNNGLGRDQVVMTLRAILESEGNQNALVEPIVSAVATCVEPRFTDRGIDFIAAFDSIPLVATLEAMRGLELFRKSSIGHYLAIAIRNKLIRILEPAKSAKVEREPKPVPPRVTRVEKNVALGLELLALRSTIRSNAAFGHAVRHRFNVDGQHACEAMKAARMYGHRPEVFTRLSWNALLHLASPTLPAAAREALEARILAGERIGAGECRAARGAVRMPRRHAERAARLAA
jgi:hypothetical protein